MGGGAARGRGETLGEAWGTAEREEAYYRIVDVPIPEELSLECGSFDILPDGRLAIGTRRGEIWLVEGAFTKYPQPEFHAFASGLDEVLGLGYRDGSFWITQQTEVTRVTDRDGDDRADAFETISDAWGFNHYHEFAFGSKPDAEGNVWVALCLSESYNSKVPFRGWCLKVTPDGETLPVCSGIRSPCGIGPNEHGVMFYAESQGPWNGSCSLKVLAQDGFMGHPVSYNWYDLTDASARSLPSRRAARGWLWSENGCRSWCPTRSCFPISAWDGRSPAFRWIAPVAASGRFPIRCSLATSVSAW